MNEDIKNFEPIICVLSEFYALLILSETTVFYILYTDKSLNDQPAFPKQI